VGCSVQERQIGRRPYGGSPGDGALWASRVMAPLQAAFCAVGTCCITDRHDSCAFYHTAKGAVIMRLKEGQKEGRTYTKERRHDGWQGIQVTHICTNMV